MVSAANKTRIKYRNSQKAGRGNVVDDVYKWHDELAFTRRWYESYLLRGDNNVELGYIC